MKIAKKVSLALIVCATASFTSACGWFEDTAEDEQSMFYDPDGSSLRRSSASGGGAGNIDSDANAAGVDGADDPNLDLTGLQGTEADNGAANGGDAAVDSWGANPAAGQDGAPYADGFGARVANVNFEPVYFLFDQNLILQTEEYKLQAVADYLKANANIGVVIEGNCDSRGTTEYNRALGEKRAIAAKTFLTAQGIAESRIKTMSYGEERPAVPGESEDAFSRNRRDEIVPVYLLK